MSINKTIQIDGVELSFHRVNRILFTRNTCLAVVASWVNQAASAGRPHIADSVLLPLIPQPGPTMFDDVEQVLITDSSGPFFGGEFVPDAAPMTELEKAKLDKWREIKAERNRREYGTFTASTGQTIDIDQASQIRVQSGYNLAVDAKAASQAFSIDWTLTDDTIVTLNANQMIALAKQVYQYIGDLHATARSLRNQISTATSVEEVAVIAWL